MENDFTFTASLKYDTCSVLREITQHEIRNVVVTLQPCNLETLEPETLNFELETSNTPILTAVGLGPGDPDLITVKGLRAIEAADVIFVPRSRDDGDSVARQIAAKWLSNHQTIIPVTTPMTRDESILQQAWQSAAQTIHRALHPADGQSRRGAYLILGDSLLYGTFPYILNELQQITPDIRFDVIPGVPSFVAAAAQTRTLLGAADDRIAIVPANRRTDTTALRALFFNFKTVVLLKVGKVFPQLVSALMELHLLEHSAYFERVGMPDERIVIGSDILAMPRRKQPYLSLMIVRVPEAGTPLPETTVSSGYPVTLTRLSGKTVVVVGGGAVGERKVRGLLATRAAVTLVSPTATPQLQQWANTGKIRWEKRPFHPKDIVGATLIFAATDNRVVNATIGVKADAAGVLCNIADDPTAGSFHLPAVYRNGDITVAVSTGGTNPARAAKIRNRLATILPLSEEAAI